MVREKYGVRLEPEQRDRLEHLVRAGKSPARVATRARILLKTPNCSETNCRTTFQYQLAH